VRTKTPWRRATEDEYRALDVRAHGILAGIPLHDAWCVSLAAPADGCSMLDVRRVMESLVAEGWGGGSVSALFGLRRALGRLFGWDRRDPPSRGGDRLAIPGDLGAASLVPPGSFDGPFRIAYVLDREALSEIHNRTVDAFLVWALRPAPASVDLFFGIHTRRSSWLTGLYLTAIEPFRRFLVYPHLLRRFHDRWEEVHRSAVHT
jgi:hypothetical protein